MILLSLTACQPIADYDTDTDDDIAVVDIFWSSYGNVKQYPFTIKSGHIACSFNEVDFYPDDTANDESSIGWPLNKVAQDSLKSSGMKPNVENAIKPNADLSEAIRMGLDRCKQVQQQLDEFRSEIS
ncbi:hypothetical protein M0N77_06390 [Psychrobacter sp. AH5]|uniref:hypothetical protein n=1 Tax=Psychrobacter sp. AH5 TaxID=2937433 RepID=UPI003341BC9D